MSGTVSNEYAQQVKEYDLIPKAVWAAIAISVLTCGGDHMQDARKLVFGEWKALNDAGIVPQKPIGYVMKELEESSCTD